MSESEKYKILIVDDSALNRSILVDILENRFTILEAENGLEAVQMIKKYHQELSLILLDLVMPDMDGLDVLSVMNRNDWLDDVPVIMISSENMPSIVEHAYDLGVTDFISRPFNVFVVRKRIANSIMLYEKQRSLLKLAKKQIYEKEKDNNLLIHILSHIVEFRNGESGLHILHVNTLTEMLLKRLVKKTDQYHLSNEQIQTIVTASSLHDIGKISISEQIVNKPGSLTQEEFEIVKQHAKAGADMLGSMTEYQDEPLIVTARDICLYHHERYDGQGYPMGLSGDEIPISAQVVAIADVYDALVSERCYKGPIEHSEAIRMIVDGACGCFNPILLECLVEIGCQIEKELKTNSVIKRNEREIKRVIDEMLSQNEFSVTGNSINYLEQERIKYEFFASLSQEIQFDYTVSPPILNLSEWCTQQYHLPQVVVNPLQNRKILELIGEEQLQNIFFPEINRTTPEEPVTQFMIQLRVDGQLRHHRVHCRVNWSQDEPPKIIGSIGKIVDVEDEYLKMMNLRHQAAFDQLTNIYNHGTSVTLVKEALEHAADKKYALMLFDLDNFKIANDTFGHMFGDRVLKTVADALKKLTGEHDIVSRIGGDEFLIFSEYADEAALKNRSHEISDAINALQCEHYSVQVSMGVATTQQTGYDYDALFFSADSALYCSKKSEKGICTFYDKLMQMSESSAMTPIEN